MRLWARSEMYTERLPVAKGVRHAQLHWKKGNASLEKKCYWEGHAAVHKDSTPHTWNPSLWTWIKEWLYCEDYCNQGLGESRLADYIKDSVRRQKHQKQAASTPVNSSLQAIYVQYSQSRYNIWRRPMQIYCVSSTLAKQSINLRGKLATFSFCWTQGDFSLLL